MKALLAMRVKSSATHTPYTIEGVDFTESCTVLGLTFFYNIQLRAGIMHLAYFVCYDTITLLMQK